MRVGDAAHAQRPARRRRGGGGARRRRSSTSRRRPASSAAIAVVAVAAGLVAAACLCAPPGDRGGGARRGPGARRSLAVQIAQAVVDRPRPAGALVATDGASFPSGHAAYAVAWVAIVVAVARVLPGLGRARRRRWSIAARARRARSASSRVDLRAHYFTDVLAGCGAGRRGLRSVRHRGPARRAPTPQWRLEMSNEEVTYVVVGACAVLGLAAYVDADPRAGLDVVRPGLWSGSAPRSCRSTCCSRSSASARPAASASPGSGTASRAERLGSIHVR